MKFLLPALALSVFIPLMLSGCSRGNETASAVSQHADNDTLYVLFNSNEILFSADPKYKIKNQIKWTSKYKEVIYTQFGRIVKTESFPNGNLLFSYSNETDPLALNLLKESTSRHWQRIVDWSPLYMGVTLNSTFEAKGVEDIALPGKILNTETILFIEKVSVPTLNISYSNRFWLHPDNGRVVKSEQHFNPKQRPIVLIRED